MNWISATFYKFTASSFLGFPTWYTYLPKNGDGTPEIKSLADIWLVVAAIIEILLRIAALAAIAFVIVGGVKYITSQGEPDAATKARSTLISALVGLAIAVLAATLVAYLAGRFKAS